MVKGTLSIASEEKKTILETIKLCNSSYFLNAEDFEKMKERILISSQNNPSLYFALKVAFHGHPMIVGGQVAGGELQGLAVHLKKILEAAEQE